jgi:hypothetical protein
MHGGVAWFVPLIKCCSCDQIKKSVSWAFNKYGDRTGLNTVLAGKYERKKSLERPRCRWENNIKIDLKEVE